MSYADAVRALPVREDALILGIETSCDETAVSLVRGGREVLADEIISSAAEHAKFGGVVPEIASRAHTEAISVAAARALKAAGVFLPEVDAVAVTYGAGLLGALLVGVSYGKGLAFAKVCAEQAVDPGQPHQGTHGGGVPGRQNAGASLFVPADERRAYRADPCFGL